MVASSLGGILPLVFSGSTLAATLDVCPSGCTYTSIQAAVNAANTGDTITVAAGTYTENVNVNKAVTVQGAGAATTKIVATNANAAPLTFSGNNATVSGFTLTHNYTAAELSAWNFNNNDVTFNQLTSGNTLKNSTVTLGRNGIYLNNSHDNVITGNIITDNRTGINMTNDLHGTQITDNVISHNWTEGLVTYSATASLPIDYSTVTVTGNTFDQNWYEEITVKDAGSSTGTLDVTNNTFTDNPVTYSTSADTSLNEPGFAAQQPVELGGTATQPATDLPTLRIYNSPAVTLKYAIAPTLLAPSNGASVNGASVTNSWTAVPSAVKYEYQSFNANNPASPVRFDGVYVTTSKTATSVADGTVFYWRVRGIFADGSTGPWSNGGNLWKVTVDSSKPSTPTLLTPSNNGYENTNDFYFTWTDSSDSGSPVTYEFQSDNNSAFSSPWDSIANGNSEQNHLTSPKIHSTGAPDGTYYWRVRAIDAAGNTSNWSSTWKMTIDTHAPSAFTLTGPSPVANSFEKNTNFNFTWNAATDSSDVTYKICRSQIAPVGGVVRCDWGWTVPSADGTHFPFNSTFAGNNGNTTWYWQVIATDDAGNSTRSDVGKVTIDSTRPTVTFVNPTDFSKPFSTGPDLQIQATDIDSGIASTVLHIYNADDSPAKFCPVSNADTTSCDASSLPDGSYYVKAGATDNAGNNQTIRQDFTIDRAAPAVTDNLDVSLFTGDNTILSPIVSDASPVTYQWVVSDIKLLNDPHDTLDGSTLKIGPAPKGSYTVTLTVTDQAGNPTTVAYNVTISDHSSNIHTVALVGGLGGGNFNQQNSSNGNTAPQVLGVSTTTPSNTDTPNSSDDNGKVKGDSTVKVADAASKHSNFLGLGWWWLAVLAALLAFFWFLAGKRADESNN